MQRCLNERIERDVANGALPPTMEATELSGAVMEGMSVLARDGATRAALLAIVPAVLRAWPLQSTWSNCPKQNS